MHVVHVMHIMHTLGQAKNFSSAMSQPPCAGETLLGAEKTPSVRWVGFTVFAREEEEQTDGLAGH